MVHDLISGTATLMEIKDAERVNEDIWNVKVVPEAGKLTTRFNTYPGSLPKGLLNWIDPDVVSGEILAGAYQRISTHEMIGLLKASNEIQASLGHILHVNLYKHDKDVDNKDCSTIPACLTIYREHVIADPQRNVRSMQIRTMNTAYNQTQREQRRILVSMTKSHQQTRTGRGQSNANATTESERASFGHAYFTQTMRNCKDITDIMKGWPEEKTAQLGIDLIYAPTNPLAVPLEGLLKDAAEAAVIIDAKEQKKREKYRAEEQQTAAIRNKRTREGDDNSNRNNPKRRADSRKRGR